MITEEEFRALKPGDRVLVENEVIEWGLMGSAVVISGVLPDGTRSAIARDIHSILRRRADPIKVGDVVTWGAAMVAYEVLAIARDYAFLVRVDSDHATAEPVSVIRRAAPDDDCWPAIQLWQVKNEGAK